MQLKFEYQGNKITFISNYTGTERVYVNGEVVSSQSSSIIKNSHKLFIGEDALQIKSEITGVLIPKLKVSLYADNTLLKAKTTNYYGVLDTDIMPKPPKMSKDESNWVREIEVSNATTIMMYGLYFGLIVFTAGRAFGDDSIISNIGLFVSATSVLGAIFIFARTCYLDLVKRE